jgi:hypothetical protein
MKPAVPKSQRCAIYTRKSSEHNLDLEFSLDAEREACEAYIKSQLKNRFYIGEVHCRGEVYRGKHEPILSRDMFEAVRAKLAGNAVARQVRLKGSAAILACRLYDDRGSRMSPTHANKKGVRYRYYVSQALLQNRKAEAGSIARVPAPESCL